ncbi:hypothetical protein Shyhy01_74140 [Streptomyces hygroscopicus subsp. hygroscopicus]|nr:hypothetical protein Shyhy01_74140 [Streptomyces hygroscopicus subsp. hygroscopicus]
MGQAGAGERFVTLVTRAPSTGLRRGPIRFPDGHPPVPSGCRWCGMPEGTHGRRRYIPSAGTHAWEIVRRTAARRACCSWCGLFFAGHMTRNDLHLTITA